MQYAKKLDNSQWGKGTRSKAATKFALLMSGDDGMVQTALIVSLLASISIAFPDASPLLIDQVMSITATTMIVTMIVSSKLAQYFDKKNIIIIGTAIFMVAGLAAIVAPSIELLILTRGILGIGAGLSFPLVPSAIAYLFNEHEKNQMLGWMNACGGILSFTLGIGSGLLAEIDWRISFILYLIFVPVLILQWICLPNFKPERREQKEAAAASLQDFNTQSKERINWKMWFNGICMVLFMCFMMAAIFRLSLFVETSGIGTPANSGTASSINTAGAFLISLFFSQFIKLTKKYAVVISLLFATIFFVLLQTATNVFMVYAATVFMGFAMGTFNPFMFATMSNVAPESRKTIGMTMMCIFQLGGQIFTPYYIMFVNYLGFVDDRALFGFTAGLFFAATIVTAILLSVIKIKDNVLPKEQ